MYGSEGRWVVEKGCIGITLGISCKLYKQKSSEFS